MIFFVFIIVDNTRLIGRLGTNFPVPVEVFPVALGRAGNKKIRGYGNYAPAGKRERGQQNMALFLCKVYERYLLRTGAHG